MPEQGSGRRKIGKTEYQAQGVLYLPESARFGYPLNLPEGYRYRHGHQPGDNGYRPRMKTSRTFFPKTCNRIDKTLLVSLLNCSECSERNVTSSDFGVVLSVGSDD
jgi:type I restriction enzyme M protein